LILVLLAACATNDGALVGVKSVSIAETTGGYSHYDNTYEILTMSAD
jgi:hypothetical protein